MRDEIQYQTGLTPIRIATFQNNPNSLLIKMLIILFTSLTKRIWILFEANLTAKLINSPQLLK